MNERRLKQKCPLKRRRSSDWQVKESLPKRQGIQTTKLNDPFKKQRRKCLYDANSFQVENSMCILDSSSTSYETCRSISSNKLQKDWFIPTLDTIKHYDKDRKKSNINMNNTKANLNLPNPESDDDCDSSVSTLLGYDSNKNNSEYTFSQAVGRSTCHTASKCQNKYNDSDGSDYDINSYLKNSNNKTDLYSININSNINKALKKKNKNKRKRKSKNYQEKKNKKKRKRKSKNYQEKKKIYDYESPSVIDNDKLVSTLISSGSDTTPTLNLEGKERMKVSKDKDKQIININSVNEGEDTLIKPNDNFENEYFINLEDCIEYSVIEKHPKYLNGLASPKSVNVVSNYNKHKSSRIHLSLTKKKSECPQQESSIVPSTSKSNSLDRSVVNQKGGMNFDIQELMETKSDTEFLKSNPTRANLSKKPPSLKRLKGLSLSDNKDMACDDEGVFTSLGCIKPLKYSPTKTTPYKTSSSLKEKKSLSLGYNEEMVSDKQGLTQNKSQVKFVESSITQTNLNKKSSPLKHVKSLSLNNIVELDYNNQDIVTCADYVELTESSVTEQNHNIKSFTLGKTKPYTLNDNGVLNSGNEGLIKNVSHKLSKNSPSKANLNKRSSGFKEINPSSLDGYEVTDCDDQGLINNTNRVEVSNTSPTKAICYVSSPYKKGGPIQNKVESTFLGESNSYSLINKLLHNNGAHTNEMKCSENIEQSPSQNNVQENVSEIYHHSTEVADKISNANNLPTIGKVMPTSNKKELDCEDDEYESNGSCTYFNEMIHNNCMEAEESNGSISKESITEAMVVTNSEGITKNNDDPKQKSLKNNQSINNLHESCRDINSDNTVIINGKSAQESDGTFMCNLNHKTTKDNCTKITSSNEKESENKSKNNKHSVNISDKTLDNLDQMPAECSTVSSFPNNKQCEKSSSTNMSNTYSDVVNTKSGDEVDSDNSERHWFVGSKIIKSTNNKNIKSNYSKRPNNNMTKIETKRIAKKYSDVTSSETPEGISVVTSTILSVEGISETSCYMFQTPLEEHCVMTSREIPENVPVVTSTIPSDEDIFQPSCDMFQSSPTNISQELRNSPKRCTQNKPEDLYQIWSSTPANAVSGNNTEIGGNSLHLKVVERALKQGSQVKMSSGPIKPYDILGNSDDNSENSHGSSYSESELISDIDSDLDTNPNNSKDKQTQKERREKLYTSNKRKTKSNNKSSLNISRNHQVNYLDSEEETQTLLEKTVCEVQSMINVSDEDIERCKNLHIKVTWDLSYLHKVDNGSKRNTFEKLKKRLRHSDIELKTTNFTNKEEDMISNNWRKFSKKYKFKDPRLFMISKKLHTYLTNEELHKFKQYLARGLPNRRLYSVYLKFNDMFGVKTKGRWTLKEDQLLIKLMHMYDQCGGRLKYNMERQIFLQKALGRTWMAIHRRMQILNRDQHQRSLSLMKVDWTPELQGEIVHYLLKKSNLELEDLRYEKIPTEVWISVAKKIHLDVKKIMDHWKYHLYTQLFASKPVLRHHVQIHLIKRLYRDGHTSWEEVDWSALSRKMGDLGSSFLNRCFRTLVSNYVPKNLQKDFEGSIGYLYEEYLPHLEKKRKSILLKRLRYDPETRLVETIEEDEDDCTLFSLSDVENSENESI